jgi:hypothetical membrane protein
MAFFSTIARLKARVESALTGQRVVRHSLEACLVGYLSLLVVAVIVAAAGGPEGYAIWTHYISDLGSYHFTPAPVLYDAACVVAGVLTIPFTLFLERTLAPLPRSASELPVSRLRIQLATLGVLCSLLGNLGYIFVGIFSEDRALQYGPQLYDNLHMAFSGVTFVGFAVGAFFNGWLIVIYQTGFPKALGWYAAFGPLGSLALNGFGWNITQSTGVDVMPLFEWFMLFAIMGFLIPASIIVMKHHERFWPPAV